MSDRPDSLERPVDAWSPFSLEEYAGRLERVRTEMANEGIDVLYVTDPAHMCYLHGYDATWYRAASTSQWPPLAGTAVHVGRDHPIHFDQLEHLALLDKTSIVEERRYFPDESLASGLETLTSELAAAGWLEGTVGLEFHSPVPYPAVSKKMEAAFASHGVRIVDGSFVTRRVRSIKSPRELACIEEAMRICDIGHRAAFEAIRPGVSELEVQGEVLRAMLAAGGEMQAINQGIQSGPIAPHEPTGRRVIRADELVFLDLCGVFHRYHANVCRGYWAGHPPAKVVDLYKKSAGGFDVLCREAYAGRTVREVGAALREYYQAEGLWELRYYLGGYELGIAFPPDWVGEFCFDAQDEDASGQFRENMVTNFESISAIPLDDKAGGRARNVVELGVENTVFSAMIDTVVYGRASARTLSHTPKRLFVVNA